MHTKKRLHCDTVIDTRKKDIIDRAGKFGLQRPRQQTLLFNAMYLLQSQWGGVHFMIRSTQLSQQRDCPMSIPRGSTGGGK